MPSSVYSSPKQLSLIKKILTGYIRLPFSDSIVPGAIMEGVLARVRGGQVLKTYDFIDVVKSEDRIGWQIKSTKEDTPVTWKRAKIPNKQKLIAESQRNAVGREKLGSTIINLCNQHIQKSIKTYNLDQIGYCRLIIHDGGKVTYFERLLCTRAKPQVFDPNDFIWEWSEPKDAKEKEQLPAFHGTNRETGKKWWAWHGLSENQLHFSGEENWWPKKNKLHALAFRFPTTEEKLSLEDFLSLLKKFDGDS